MSIPSQRRSCSLAKGAAVLLGALWVSHSVAASARADGPLPPDESLAALEVAEGLEASLFAAEPMISNPTNIAVDSRGRLWVCDVVNYRRNLGKRPEGDRILILEDEDGDGRADVSKVFYQGADVDSALGICLLGDRVIVCCSPNVFVLYDDDGDDRADRKEALFSNTGISQHDHAAHAFVLGPDEMLYWNIGNQHHGVFDRNGDVIVDVFGREVRPGGPYYRQGMAFRCDFEGRNFEVLAHNLRNSYELAVDSFGAVWFTDNDDDGNQGTRVCATLEGGNYGYVDEMTGAGWRTPRTGMHADIPLRHWRQNDPGVVPNMLLTGFGSPSGVIVYEGSLLPERYRGHLIHCEPGRNLVRCYRPQKAGAGHTAEILPVVDGSRDQFFRPVDVVTAPDGSLFIADWYDPGVGGHRQGDVERGRIYRIAPADATYQTPSLNSTATDDVIAAINSGCIPLQFEGYQALAKLGDRGRDRLAELAKTGSPPQRARAYWRLARSEDGGRWALQALHDEDPNVQAAAVRMTRVIDAHAQSALLRGAASSPSPLVRREAAIALRRYQGDDASDIWRELATEFDGADSWYLEALGLGAAERWDDCMNAWQEFYGAQAWRSPEGRAVLWRSRGSRTFSLLVSLLSDPSTPKEELHRLLRALDFAPAEPGEADKLLTRLTAAAITFPSERRLLIGVEALKRLRTPHLSDRQKAVATQLLQIAPRDDAFVDLIRQFKLDGYYDELFALATGRQAATGSDGKLLVFLLDQGYVESLKEIIPQRDEQARQLISMLANLSDARVASLLLPVVADDEVEVDARREAVRAIAASRNGAGELLDLAEAGKLDEKLESALHFALKATPWQDLQNRAAPFGPADVDSHTEQLPVALWMKRIGDPRRGEKLFAGKGTCSTCHKVGDVGKDVGPALTEIGSKLSRTGLYEAILYPSAAISHNYETYLALTDSGISVSGVLTNETPEEITLVNDKAKLLVLRRDEVEVLEKQTVSLMPSGLHRLLNAGEIADVVAYLSSLRRPAFSSASQSPGE